MTKSAELMTRVVRTQPMVGGVKQGKAFLQVCGWEDVYGR